MNNFRLYTHYQPLIITIICLLGVIHIGTAQQNRAAGLVFNPEKYKKGVKKQKLDGEEGVKSNGLPLTISLRPFCPLPQDQGEELSCTMWASIHGIMSIYHAIERKAVTPLEVSKITFSKAYAFNQMVDSVKQAVPVEDVFQFLQKKGTCLATTFRTDAPLEQKPDALANEEAHYFRLDRFAEVYDPDTAITQAKHILRFKRLLADSMPIFIGIHRPDFFNNIGTKKWRLDSSTIESDKAHALCLIGYDDIDSTFEVMNSYGCNWGDNGFTKIHYHDLIRLLVCAYTLKPHFETSKTFIEIVLRRPSRYTSCNDAQYEEVRVHYNSEQQVYQTVQEKWMEGTGFQMALRKVPVGWHVYAFGMNPMGEVSIFHESVMEKNNIEKVIPSENTQLAMESGGSEYMCLIFSKHPLSNFKEKIKKLEKPTNGNFYAQLQKAFSKTLLINPRQLQERMACLNSKETDKAIGLVLKIN